MRNTAKIEQKTRSKKKGLGVVIGEKFGLLTILKDCGYVGNGDVAYKMVLVECGCGNRKKIKMCELRRGRAKDCGCSQKKLLSKRSTKHGLYNHPIFKIWSGMNGRCNDKKNENYGGRGVSVCNEWRHDFVAFYDWAKSNGWRNGLQLDKDIKAREKGVESILYSPEMCMFVTHKVNASCTRKCAWVEHDGVAKPLSEWADLYKVNLFTVKTRIKRGWPIAEALDKKKRNNGNEWEEKKNKIYKIIKKYFGVNFLQKSSKKSVCFPRQVYVYCLNKFTKLNYPQIASASGYSDHTNVFYCIKTINNLVQYDERVRRQLMEIESMIK